METYVFQGDKVAGCIIVKQRQQLSLIVIHIVELDALRQSSVRK